MMCRFTFFLLPIFTLAVNCFDFDGMQNFDTLQNSLDSWEQQMLSRPAHQQWRLQKWNTVEGNGRSADRFIRRTRSVAETALLVDAIDKAAQPQPAAIGTAEWASTFDGDQSSPSLLRKLAEVGEEPLVFSRYNRDCFFTPVNCLVGRAGQQASNIVGSATNGKRQILFIKRRHRKNKRGHRQQQKKARRMAKRLL